MLPDFNTIFSRWKSALSPDCADIVRTDATTLQAHVCQGVLPGAVALPENETQVAELIRTAASLQLPVVPFGGGTGQGIGSPPPPNSIIISTRALNQIIQHEPGDMVATVQTGMTFGVFQKLLAAQGQSLPLDADPKATLGGLIATDRHGPRSLGYGTLRDMVLGLTVVNGDGVIRKCGGRVVKNVTGYALDKIYVGSLGTLGLITEVTFKLRPLPIASRYWKLELGNVANALTKLNEFFACNLPLEMLALNFTPKAIHIAVLASGAHSDLDRISRELQLDSQAVNNSEAQTAALDPWLRLITTKASAKSSVLIRVWNLPTRLSVLWSVLSESANEAVLSPHGGWIRLSASPEKIQKTLAQLSAEGFNWRLEDATDVRIEAPFGPSRPEWALMKNIHLALDPNAIMNRGRFVV